MQDLFANKHEMDIEQKIVEELLNDKNLATKTELANPIKWTALNTIVEYLRGKTIVNAPQILQNFIDVAFKFLISKDRKGRLEYIQALQNIKKEEQITDSISSMKVMQK